MLQRHGLVEDPSDGVSENVDGLGVGELGPVAVEIDPVSTEVLAEIAVHVPASVKSNIQRQ